MRVNVVVNGEHREADLAPGRSLAEVLGSGCGLTSVYTGCTDGTCGSCTVLVDGEPVRSCLMFAVQADGAEVGTAEGLAPDHPLRPALRQDAGECGPCLPGSVMLVAGALEHDPGLAGDPGRLRRLLAANLCRQPGHDEVRRAVVRAATAGQAAST